jgi:hypothetical protein
VNRVLKYFENEGHAINVGTESKPAASYTASSADFDDYVVTLFGNQALSQLEDVSKTIFQTPFGQAVLADAQDLNLQIMLNRITPASAISILTQEITKQARLAGAADFDAAAATLIGCLAMAKAQGFLTAPLPPAPPEPPIEPEAPLPPAPPEPPIEPEAPLPPAPNTPPERKRSSRA